MNYPYVTNKYEYVILGSRFIGLLIPFDDEKDINTLLAKVREDYPKATHYPYAARLLPFERCSDEGEPARSTGLPLLEILRGREVDHALLVVIRYFGGTKLGLGRLTRTYREVGLEAVEEASWCEFVEGYEARLSMSYSDFSSFQKDADRFDLKIEDEDFQEEVTITLKGDKDIASPLVERYSNMIKINEEKTITVKRRIEK